MKTVLPAWNGIGLPEGSLKASLTTSGLWRQLTTILALVTVMISGGGSASALASRTVIQPAGCHPPSLANCYTEATMQSYIDRVLPMIAQFFRAQYAAMPTPRQYYFIAEGQQAQSACQGLVTGRTYAYCPGDHNVYMGQAMMWHLYSQDGDIAPAVGLAHEWGHNVQTQTGVPAPQTNEESVNYEDQADCIAGAWLQYAGQPSQHWLEPEDAPNMGLLIEDIASAENDPNRNHGDLQERAASMLRGMQGGLMSCNDFYPSTPIYVPSK